MNFYPSLALILLPPAPPLTRDELRARLEARDDVRFAVSLELDAVYLEGLGNYARAVILEPEEVARAVALALTIAEERDVSARARASIRACAQAIRLSSGSTNELSYIEVMSEACARLEALPGAIIVDLDTRTIELE